MRILIICLVTAAIWVAVMLAKMARRAARRRMALSQPFPESWLKILESNLSPYSHLPATLQEEIQHDVAFFLHDKAFEGCGGQEITDEIRVTIAAQACMLLLNRNDKCYPRLRTILVYPSTYVAGGKGLFGAQHEEPSARLGESWNTGVVVLSWSSVRQGAFNFEDGHNVTMHEFAHQLDQEDGSADGAPILERRSGYSSWAKIFSKEFHELQKKSRKGKRDVMDSYGATNPAEFFAVATESFFEKPRQLQKKHPELYDQLSNYYKVDPTDWL